ncbi:hypothetical protein XarbCFBP8142_10680 [Xanthomonas arboricola]|nr:hypothetical protein XarbCFBP8132_06830 [Xanthomonas arboricola]PPT68968.1 hypothetical protein XarbCFBP8142_10680 [Xanthomonas arboricola]
MLWRVYLRTGGHPSDVRGHRAVSRGNICRGRAWHGSCLTYLIYQGSHLMASVPKHRPSSSRVLPVFCAALVLWSEMLSPASAQQAPQSSTAYQGWAAMADKDVDFSLQWFRDQSIMAVYPDPSGFEATLSKARKQADADLQQVKNFEGYRQTMAHLFSTFNDAHAYVSIELTPVFYQWPGFLAVYQGRRFLVAGSEGVIANGAEITECDGLPMAEWSKRVAPYQNMIPGLESTHARVALNLFRDSASPFIARPRSCIVDGRSVDLQWHIIPTTELAKIRSQLVPQLGRSVTVEPFGNDGAWVRLGNFSPRDRKESDQFEALYKVAPSLRDKSIIVLDVRGNTGGPYEWFMGVLRALYGREYANYYARERLKISAVLRVSKEHQRDAAAPQGQADPSAPAEGPKDGTPYDADNSLYAAAVARGETVIKEPVNANKVPKPRRIPANPVRAKVFVLTDYDCGSACIAFVDELKNFPGVKQVGLETFVDTRTGSPVEADLPSSNGVIAVPYVTRDGRQRNDNVPQQPEIEYKGNIADTASVKAWIEKIARE